MVPRYAPQIAFVLLSLTQLFPSYSMSVTNGQQDLRARDSLPLLTFKGSSVTASRGEEGDSFD